MIDSKAHLVGNFPDLRCGKPRLIELHLQSVRIRDIDRKPVGAIVEIPEEIYLIGFKAVAHRPHVIHLESDVVHLTMSGFASRKQSDPLLECAKMTAVGERLCRPDPEAKLCLIKYSVVFPIFGHYHHMPYSHRPHSP